MTYRQVCENKKLKNFQKIFSIPKPITKQKREKSQKTLLSFFILIQTFNLHYPQSQTFYPISPLQNFKK